MSTEPEVMPGAKPFSAAGDQRGALVLHGFTGSPQSMRPLAQAFAGAGFTVELPRLPGHGTTPEDMVGYRFRDWAAAVEAAYKNLASRTSSIVVAGLSMGGSLALWLAQRHPDIKGIVLINPAAEPDDFAPFVDGANAVLSGGGEFLPAVAGDIADPNGRELGYDRSPAAALVSLVDALVELKPKLSDIKMPILLMHSPQDHVVPQGSAALLRSRLGSAVDYVPLERSFHVATLDYDADEINRRAVAFGKMISG